MEEGTTGALEHRRRINPRPSALTRSGGASRPAERPVAGARPSSVCGRPQGCKKILERAERVVEVLPCVRPVDAAVHTPLARMEFEGQVQFAFPRLRRFGTCWFSWPRLVDVAPYLLLTFLRPRRLRPERLLCRGGRSSVGSPVRHQRPDDPRHLVGQRDHHEHARLARQHARQPAVGDAGRSRGPRR